MRDQVFISYSHRDARWLERLQVYLAPLERRGLVRRWDDTLIAPGQRWQQSIAAALDRTRVAVVLVSADFLASDFIARVELPRLLGGAEDQGVTIIPVVLDHCNFDRCAELAQFQAIHPPAQPLETLPEPEQKAVLARLAAAVEDLLAKPAGGAAAPAVGRLVGLPARNPLFTGRGDALAAVTQALDRSGRAALCGLAGLGKSEAAIEYAHRQRASYDWVAWVRADSAPQITLGFCAIAVALGLPEARGADQAAAAGAALAALSASGRSLLVLDAADDLDLARQWLPSGDGAQLLMTTRSAAVGGIAEAVELESFDADDATAFLLRRARLDGDGPGADPALRAAARRLALATAGLPLALDQAGAYIEETGCSLDDYAALWQGYSRTLMAERGQGSLRAGESLMHGWSLSLAQLALASPVAAELLQLLACFDGDDLPEAALATGAAAAGPALRDALAHPIARNAALREALRFAFVRRDAKTRRLRMHRLLQQFLREGESEPARRERCQQAVAVVDAAFPEARFVDWRGCDLLVAHAVAVLDQAAALAIEPTAAQARLAAELGYYLAQRARYAEAVPRIATALALRRNAAPPVPAELARALMIDGHLQIALGQLDAAAARLDEADALLQGTAAGIARVRVLDMRASVDLSRGELDAAQARLDQALAIAGAAGAGRSAEAAQCINGLGTLRFRRGDYRGARQAFEASAALRRELLPPEHPSIAQSLNNIAAACTRLGEHAAARDNYRQALSLREATLGPDHPNVAESLVNLALADLHDKDLAAARAALARAIAIRRACHRSPHLALAKAQACLADVALAEGQLDEAQQLYSQARDARVQLLGADHADAALAVVGLADVALARGDRPAAAALLQQAVPILRRRLGPAHPDVLACESDLARLTGPAPPRADAAAADSPPAA